METKIFTVTENGFSPKDKTVSCPACKIKAVSFMDAIDKLNTFLKTKQLPEDIELITPMERICFE